MVVDSNDYPHRVWSGVQGWYNISYNTHVDGVWTMPDLLSTNADYFYENQFAPQIALGPDDTPHVVWYGCTDTSESGAQNNEDVFYATRGESGWLSPALLSTTSTWNYNPQLAVDSANLANVVWYGQEDGANQIFLRHRHRGRLLRSRADLLRHPGNRQQGQRAPRIAVGPDTRPHAVWTGSDGSDQVYYNSGRGRGGPSRCDSPPPARVTRPGSRWTRTGMPTWSGTVTTGRRTRSSTPPTPQVAGPNRWSSPRHPSATFSPDRRGFYRSGPRDLGR